MGNLPGKHDVEIEKLKIDGKIRAKQIEWNAKQEIERETIKLKSGCMIQIEEIRKVKNELYLQAQLGVLNHCKDMNLSMEDACVASGLTALTLKEELDDAEKAQLRNILYLLMERKNMRTAGTRSIGNCDASSAQLLAIHSQAENHQASSSIEEGCFLENK